MKILFKELMNRFGLTANGPERWVESLSSPEDSHPDSLIVVAEKRLWREPGYIRSKAWLISKPLLNDEMKVYLERSGISYAVTDDPKKDLIMLINYFFPQPEFKTGIHPTVQTGKDCNFAEYTRVDAFVFIGDNCTVGHQTHINPNCVIGNHVRIGNQVRIHPNVTIYDHCVIGDRVIIHAGAVIGSDGFGYMKRDGRYVKIPHAGKTVIEDDVEIGANCCIDRGTLGVTRIRRGSKLDNLIQIAHNVVIGEDTVIAAQAGVAGSTVIGDSVTIAGQAGLVGHITIGNRATIGAQAGVIGSVEDGKTISGYPARDHHLAMRREAMISKIPEILETLKKLKSSES